MKNVVSRAETARKITEMATACGVTVKELSEATGVSCRTVNTWLSGKRLPGFDKLYIISGVLGCSMEEFVVLNPKEMWVKG